MCVFGFRARALGNNHHFIIIQPHLCLVHTKVCVGADCAAIASAVAGGGSPFSTAHRAKFENRMRSHQHGVRHQRPSAPVYVRVSDTRKKLNKQTDVAYGGAIANTRATPATHIGLIRSAASLRVWVSHVRNNASWTLGVSVSTPCGW